MFKKQLKQINNNGLVYYISEELNNLGFIKHFFSTRIGGLSQNEYSSLNLGVYTGDEQFVINENISRISGAAAMNKQNIVYLKQLHGNTVRVVNEDNYKVIRGMDGDALITSVKGIPIGIFTADCVPILIADKLGKAIASIHAGWKGIAGGVVEAAIHELISSFGTKAEGLIVAAGPSIGGCCFEVSEDVALKFKSHFKIQNEFHVNLKTEIYARLIELGLKDCNINMSDLCTCCEKDLFYSYRREKGKTGRMGAFIQLF